MTTTSKYHYVCSNDLAGMGKYSPMAKFNLIRQDIFFVIIKLSSNTKIIHTSKYAVKIYCKNTVKNII